MKHLVCCEALSQSLWSLMAKQVLTYTMTAPYTFLSGLILISELLPIPLPVQTNEVNSYSHYVNNGTFQCEYVEILISATVRCIISNYCVSFCVAFLFSLHDSIAKCGIHVRS